MLFSLFTIGTSIYKKHVSKMMSQTPVFTHMRVQKKYLFGDMPPTDFKPMTPTYKRSGMRHVGRGPTDSQCALWPSEQNIVYKFECTRTRASALIVSI